MAEHDDHTLETAMRFARALDQEDYAAARALLDAGCVYVIRDQTHTGADAVLASYKGAGDEAHKFDAIEYGSSVALGEPGWALITFSDHIEHRGKRLDHVCEQRVRVNARGVIDRIEHRDLPGERERADAFKREMGF